MFFSIWHVHGHQLKHQSNVLKVLIFNEKNQSQTLSIKVESFYLYLWICVFRLCSFNWQWKKLEELVHWGNSDTRSTVVYSKLCEASKMELFSKIVNSRKPLTIFAKSSIIKVSSVNLLNLDKVNVVLYVFKVNQKGTRKIARNSKMENLWISVNPTQQKKPIYLFFYFYLFIYFLNFLIGIPCENKLYLISED